jgi:hypothetical protein
VTERGFVVDVQGGARLCVDEMLVSPCQLRLKMSSAGPLKLRQGAFRERPIGAQSLIVSSK